MGAFQRFLRKHGDDVDTSKSPIPQQALILVYHSHGIIGKGGIQYLFEVDFPGEPRFLLTRQAFKTIGASNASTLFAKAFVVFSSSTPPVDFYQCLEMWQSRHNPMDTVEDKSSPDAL